MRDKYFGRNSSKPLPHHRRSINFAAWTYERLQRFSGLFKVLGFKSLAFLKELTAVLECHIFHLVCAIHAEVVLVSFQNRYRFSSSPSPRTLVISYCLAFLSNQRSNIRARHRLEHCAITVSTSCFAPLRLNASAVNTAAQLCKARGSSAL